MGHKRNSSSKRTSRLRITTSICLCLLSSIDVHSFIRTPLWSGAHTSVHTTASLSRIVSSSRPSKALSMLWSGGRKTRPDEVNVNIERPSLNTRRISGSIVVDKPIEDVWLTLTDYDSLSTYVPNLTQSRLVPHPNNGIRLFQEGAQKIIGLDFRASLVMDMEEHYGDPLDRLAMRKIKFKLVDSAMFEDFDGEWRIQFNSRQPNRNAGPGEDLYTYKTKLFYMVYIRPRGPVPVMALEWQISEEVPNNLAAVKKAAEGLTDSFFDARRAAMCSRQLSTGIVLNGNPTSKPYPPVSTAQMAQIAQSIPQNSPDLTSAYSNSKLNLAGAQAGAAGGGQSNWEADETLETYIQKIAASRR